MESAETSQSTNDQPQASWTEYGLLHGWAVVDSSHIQLGEVWRFELYHPTPDCVGLPMEASPWTGRVEFMDESSIRIGEIYPIFPGFKSDSTISINRSLLREIKKIDPADHWAEMRSKLTRGLK